MSTDDPFRCICPLDPADLVNGYPRAVEGCPAHRARYAAQQLALASPVEHPAADIRPGGVVTEPNPTRADIYLPWSYWDGVVETEIRVDDYPYGGGLAGSGIQITLGQRSDGQCIAVRLPRESAHRLARAILAGPEPAAETEASRNPAHIPFCDGTCSKDPMANCPEQPARLAAETETP